MGRFEIKPIAYIHNSFTEKFGIPRQSGLVPQALSTIVFEEEFRNDEALRGIEGYSHLWLIWQFSDSLREGFSPTVRPPRLGGNRRMGVFATRSPFRPNSLGLSSVKLERLEHTANNGTVLIVSGADLMNGTPVFDIKPYVSYSDSHPDAVSGFADDFVGYALEVECADALLEQLESSEREALLGILRNDPRPSYQHDSRRIYKMAYGSHTVAFCVDENKLIVTAIEPLE